MTHTYCTVTQEKHLVEVFAAHIGSTVYIQVNDYTHRIVHNYVCIVYTPFSVTLLLDSRYFVDVVEDRLLKSAGQRAECANGLLDSLSHFLMLQSLVVRDIIRQFPTSKEEGDRLEMKTRQERVM